MGRAPIIQDDVCVGGGHSLQEFFALRISSVAPGFMVGVEVTTDDGVSRHQEVADRHITPDTVYVVHLECDIGCSNKNRETFEVSTATGGNHWDGVEPSMDGRDQAVVTIWTGWDVVDSVAWNLEPGVGGVLFLGKKPGVFNAQDINVLLEGILLYHGQLAVCTLGIPVHHLKVPSGFLAGLCLLVVLAVPTGLAS